MFISHLIDCNIFVLIPQVEIFLQVFGSIYLFIKNADTIIRIICGKVEDHADFYSVIHEETGDYNFYAKFIAVNRYF